MYFAPLKAFLQSLRFRLMLWIGFVTLVTAIVTLWGMREGVRLTLIDEVDRVLEDDLAEVTLLLKEEQLTLDTLRDFLDRKQRGHRQSGWFVQIVNDQGEITWSRGTAPPIPISMSHDTTTFEEGDVHLRQVAADIPEAMGGSVRIGVDMRFLNEDIARIDRLALLVGFIVFLLAPIASYYLAAGAIEPVAEMINTMSRLQGSEIKDRLPIRGAGDELDKLATTFNSLLDRISEDLQEKRDFLANAAHELRTPVAAIRNLIEVTLHAERSNEDYQETLADVLEQCGSLQLIVNQLLLLAELQASRPDPVLETVQLSEVIGKSLEMFEAAAEVAEVEMTAKITPGLTIQANRLHISQIINNLIDNAIKFTPAGGKIWVELESDGEDIVELRVRDSGIGIPEEKLPRIFERFFRATEPQSAGAAKRGSGLGLSIVKSLVDRYGGEIEARSNKGGGTSFVIRWPLATAALPRTAPLASSSS